ncbi:MAG TPA: peptidase U32 family protein [Candidatus Nanoarchaeia archaeon]|nr:peptidase U32 family protein [Candidatus Nanoarchaeia archaeon]
MIKKPELLSPVSDFTSLKAAVDSGADAVYFGIKGSNMRDAKSGGGFVFRDLRKIAKYKVKKYMTINGITYDKELEFVKRAIEESKDYVDGYICWDMAVLQIALEMGVEVHLSTQASVANSTAAKFYYNLGVKRIVPARELSLEQIEKIKMDVPGLEIETFIHGSMCMAISGRCFLSQDIFKKTANKGKCLNVCRREYIIKDKREGFEMVLGDDYILNAKDLCALPFIDKLIIAGIDGFKIEGRSKKPEYVKVVTSCYREAIDACYDGKFTKELVERLMGKLETVYNRGLSSGFYLGMPTSDDWGHKEGNVATREKLDVGRVLHYYPKPGVAAIEVTANGIKKGDELLIMGETTGVVESRVISMEIENKNVDKVDKGLVGVKIDRLVRKGDHVYLYGERR